MQRATCAPGTAAASAPAPWFAQIGCCVSTRIEPRRTRDLAVPIDVRGSPLARACDLVWLAT
ncbi:hypothetical protein XarbCFBP7610_01120 [Xanthomonas arboricola]|nr:hypothetical protein XarbCFBP7610_01120 [Xanthomonas arboricola]